MVSQECKSDFFFAVCGQSQHPQLHNLALERLDVIKHGTQVHTSLFLTFYLFLEVSKSLVLHNLLIGSKLWFLI